MRSIILLFFVLISYSTIAQVIPHVEATRLWTTGKDSIVSLVNEGFEEGLGDFFNSGDFNWVTTNEVFYAGSFSATSDVIAGGENAGLSVALNIPEGFNATVQFFTLVNTDLEGVESNNPTYVFGHGTQMDTLGLANEWIPYSFLIDEGNQFLTWQVGIDDDLIQVFLDSVVVFYNAKPALKLPDGSEGLGKVLVSDKYGNASWKSLGEISNTYDNAEGNDLVPLTLSGQSKSSFVLKIIEGKDNGIISSGNGINGLLLEANPIGIKSQNNTFGIQSTSNNYGVEASNNLFDGFISDMNTNHGFRAANNGQSGFYASNNTGEGFKAEQNGTHGFLATLNDNGFQSISNSTGFYADQNAFHGFRASNNGYSGFYSLLNNEDGYIATQNAYHGFNAFNNTYYGFRSVNNGSFGYLASSNDDHGFYSLNNTGDGFYAENNRYGYQAANNDLDGFRSNNNSGNGFLASFNAGSGFHAESNSGNGITISLNGQNGVEAFFNTGNGFRSDFNDLDGFSATANNRGLYTSNNTLSGIFTNFNGSNGVQSSSNAENGYYANNNTLNGFFAENNNVDGFLSMSNSENGYSASNNTLNGYSSNNNTLNGYSASNNTLDGYYASNNTNNGFRSNNNSGNGFIAEFNAVDGFVSENNNVHGFYASNNGTNGYVATSNTANGISSIDNILNGISSVSNGSDGIFINLNEGDGIYSSNNIGDEGYFDGTVVVTGTLSKGGGSFKIDHPLDPENKYLYHSFVESPDMMNVYNGNVILNNQGEAIIQLEEWFGALNKDYRYQLTAIGAPGPNLYISEKINNNQFSIAGGTPGMEVSWQVTGIRKDPFAEKNRIPVEEEKPSEFKGYYLHPEAYNKGFEKSNSFVKMGHKTLEELKSINVPERNNKM